jgi:hypothetical protein
MMDWPDSLAVLETEPCPTVLCIAHTTLVSIIVVHTPQNALSPNSMSNPDFLQLYHSIAMLTRSRDENARFV